MKILITAGYFPPYCPASASRVNKLAKYLVDQGHDVRVLSPKDPRFPETLKAEIPQDQILYTHYTDINGIPARFKKTIRSVFFQKNKATTKEAKQEQSAASLKTTSQSAVVKKESFISWLYRAMTNIPDNSVGWYFHAIKAGKALFKHWCPDIIFATAPPFTTLLVGSRLARIVGVPWVADYRDLWSDHGYYDSGYLRRMVDILLERYMLSNCKGLVTVTESWTDLLKKKRNKPVICVMNGFDPEDFHLDDEKSDEHENLVEEEKITILYAGHLYGQKRDPSLLFEAIGRLEERAKNFKIIFYTENGLDDFNADQKKLVEKYQLEDVIAFNTYIPQKELHKVQQQVDILLLLRWNDPREDSVIAGKLFEYIGANKPILSVGSITGEAADIIRDNDFGCVSCDPDEIGRFLLQKYQEKNSKIPLKLNDKSRNNFKRVEQFSKLEKFLSDISQNRGLPFKSSVNISS
ncbi:glycosyltransferase family 4 protein [Spartinivicinus poritis]|uniref:Glycosyltransferase family 4 protein n=1 Tax=Spartinivicinus poritis TaxID=2994640 RepID=A0ABT5UC47_9GAMM|nr:glycosyltransferase family 4 protein [Spartinivicinus sp. A2-2]MDE1463956.1 glycosyltransferase family 4 protein [Spartinivicinus sp. A2-2]